MGIIFSRVSDYGGTRGLLGSCKFLSQDLRIAFISMFIKFCLTTSYDFLTVM